MAIDTITYAAAKKYTDKTVAGGGAIAGKNCTIDSITPITGGNRVTFKWTLDNGTVQTAYIDVMNGADGQDGEPGPKGDPGTNGSNGVSVQSMAIDEYGHLIITYDNGTTEDAGAIPGGGGAVDSVNGKVGVVVLTTSDLENDSDYVADPSYVHTDNNFTNADKAALTRIPLDITELQGSMAGVKSDIGNIQLDITQLQGSLANKVDKVAGKGLSTEDFLTSDMNKLRALLEIRSIGSGLNLDPTTKELTATGAAITIDSVLDKTSSNAIQNQAVAVPIEALQGSMLNKVNRTELGTAAYKDVPASGDAANGEVVLGSDSRLTDARNAADVSAWAKQPTKPSYTASEVGAVATTEVGASNGVAPLGSDQKVPAANLPSYVDDVLEYASQSAFPVTGETGKIYVDLSTNKTYRWGGTGYVSIGSDLALGETSSTAYAGNKGKANADAITAIKNGTNINSFGDVETALSNKADKVSNATNGNFAGLNSSGNLTDSGYKASDFSTVKTSETAASGGTTLSLVTTGEKFEWNGKMSDNPTFSEASTRANIVSGESFATILGKIKKYFTDLKDLAFIAKDGVSSTKFLRGDGTWQEIDGSWTSTVQVDSNNQVDFSSLNLSDEYGYDLYCENKLINIVSVNRVASGGVLTTLIYTVSGASTGDVCKLRILK